jgi:hypothetical protein
MLTTIAVPSADFAIRFSVITGIQKAHFVVAAKGQICGCINSAPPVLVGTEEQAVQGKAGK